MVAVPRVGGGAHGGGVRMVAVPKGAGCAWWRCLGWVGVRMSERGRA